MISFIIPVKNGEQYISTAIESILSFNKIKWELIIIDDASNDSTFSIVKQYSLYDNRITLKRNPGKGKVQALNYGFTLSCGDYIKCIDADDVLLKDFEQYYLEYYGIDAHFHGALVTDENLNGSVYYPCVPDFNNISESKITDNCISPARWTWTFKRIIAEKLFPMPYDLPFEDVWFSIMIKKKAYSIQYIPRSLYLYRQHNSNTFGGILNFNTNTVIFRANRMIGLIDCLQKNRNNIFSCNQNGFCCWNEILLFNHFLAQKNPDYFKILNSPLSFFLKIKILVQKKFSSFAPILIILKWKWDQLKVKLNRPEPVMILSRNYKHSNAREA